MSARLVTGSRLGGTSRLRLYGQGVADFPACRVVSPAGAVRMPRPALLPVILGQPHALGDLLAGRAAAPPATGGGAGHG